MNTHSHLYIAESRARELHRAAALSRMAKADRRRQRVTIARSYTVVTRLIPVLARRG